MRQTRTALPIVVVLGLGLTACGSAGRTATSSTRSSSSTAPRAGSTTTQAGATGFAATVTSPGEVNPAAIPLGDGYLSTSAKVGSVDSCQTAFPSIGGAQAVGPWINTTAKTWDSLTKIRVQGAVSWPSASYSVTVSGASRIIRTNDLPTGHDTGTFPVASGDPASAYDRNPNSITAQSITWTLPLDPTAAATPSCTPGGPIGVLNDGVLVFNALDGEGRDAGAHEILDSCDEHPQMNNELHHHFVPSCILDKSTGSSTLVGYALDGYGIYVERDSSGQLLTNTDLDACHGRASEVLWNGKEQTVYHYDATLDYPYTVGCFHGTPISTGG
ncbi:MAG TPA: YHYH protein [Acidimicrobiales bacterium]|nr:YHYH protein [Acidimicrobiales bacterium]